MKINIKHIKTKTIVITDHPVSVLHVDVAGECDGVSCVPDH